MNNTETFYFHITVSQSNAMMYNSDILCKKEFLAALNIMRIMNFEQEITSVCVKLLLVPFGTYLPCCNAPPASTTAVLKSAT